MFPAAGTALAAVKTVFPGAGTIFPAGRGVLAGAGTVPAAGRAVVRGAGAVSGGVERGGEDTAQGAALGFPGRGGWL